MYIIKKELPFNYGKLIEKRNKTTESAMMNGLFRIHSIKNNIKKQIDEFSNLIMDDAHDKVARSFIGYSNVYYYQIRFLGIGDDDTAVTGTDTILGNEVYRVPFVAQGNPSQKVVTTDFYITDSEFAGDIEEFGLFCGDDASIAEGFGNLLSHVLWSYSKSSSEELLIEYELTIS